MCREQRKCVFYDMFTVSLINSFFAQTLVEDLRKQFDEQNLMKQFYTMDRSEHSNQGTREEKRKFQDGIHDNKALFLDCNWLKSHRRKRKWTNGAQAG